MMGTISRGLALAAMALVGSAQLAAAQSECMTSKCQNLAAISAMQTGIAGECDCAGATNAKKYMQCVKKSLNAAIASGGFPRSCKTAVARCEAAVGCGKGLRPFRTIQTVFTQSCALSTCHSTLTRQGGLVLESEEVAYAALVDRPASHPEAGGAKLVVPGDPKSSFLVRKLRGTAPGDRMPVGSQLSDGTIKLIERWIDRGAKTTFDECPPSDGSGKKRKGKKACNDRPLRTGNFVWEPQPALEPPAPGTGLQLYTPKRDVVPGTEWETCFAFKNIPWQQLGLAAGYAPGETPIIKKQTYRMHEGSHHLLLYAYFGPTPEGWADGFFPCNAANCESENPNDCPPDASQYTIPIGGTQVAGTRYEVNYPEGVGIPVLTPDTVLIANLHYTNPFQPAQPIYSEAWLNLDFYKPGEFKAILDGIFAINYQDLFVEPYTSKTYSRMWMPRGLLSGGSTDAAVFQLFGHMHKRGTEFQIDIVRGGTCSGRPDWACGRDDDCRCWPGRGGGGGCPKDQVCNKPAGAEDAPIYYTSAWDRAPVVEYQKPYLLVDKTEGLRWTCTHTNGVEGDPSKPPKRCHENCGSCGWDAATRTCIFRRGVAQGYHTTLRTYAEGEPMPVVFGELADDDMCNMFGYFIKQADLPLLP
ncbi:MAG: hypothetical protein KIT14_21885 [bacterium]|nr:hypothetical protein [bacterium]